MKMAQMIKTATVALLAMVAGARAQNGGLEEAKAGLGTMVIMANGFSDEIGLAVANVYRKGDNIFRKSPVRLVGNISGGKAEFSVKNLPYGEYGVCVFHDRDGDGKLEHTFFGMPGEPIGYSNNFEWGLWAGYPSFERMKFIFAPDSNRVDLTVN